jgi:alkylhydroperoxidase family enzyme
MARLPYLRYEDAPPAVREVLDGYPPHIRSRNIFGILSHAHEAFGPMIRYGRALVTASEFPPSLREVAVLRVSHLTPGSRYIWIEHIPVAEALGVSTETIAAIESDALHALGPDEQLVVRFTDEIVRDATASDATWTAMTSRFSPREIMELIFSVGHFMTFARVHATVHVDLETDNAERPPIDRRFFGDRSTDE